MGKGSVHRKTVHTLQTIMSRTSFS
jgi:hypothetical protein